MEIIFLLPEVCHSSSCQEENLSIEKITHLFPSATIWLNYAPCLAPGELSEEHEEVLAWSPSPRVFVNYHLAPTSLAKFTGMSVSQNMSGLKSESLFFFFFGAGISRTIFSIKTHLALFSIPQSLLNTPPLPCVMPVRLQLNNMTRFPRLMACMGAFQDLGCTGRWRWIWEAHSSLS